MKKITRFTTITLFSLLITATPSNVTSVTAQDSFSSTNCGYESYLLSGFNMIEDPYPDFKSVKSTKILDQEKLAAKKADWYSARTNLNEYKFTTVTGTDRVAFNAKLSLETSISTPNAIQPNCSEKFSTCITPTLSHSNLYGATFKDITKASYGFTLTKDDLMECLNDTLIQMAKNKEYDRIFDEFGTHLIKTANFGGRLFVKYQSANYAISESSFSQQIKDAAQTLENTPSAQTSSDLQKFTANCTYTISCIGGDLSMIPHQLDETYQYKNWLASINQNTMSLYNVQECIPIWELFSDRNIQAGMQITYYNRCINKLKNFKKEFPFVTDIKAISIGEKNQYEQERNAQNQYSQTYKFTADLNGGIQKTRVYMLFQTGTDQTKKITDVKIQNYKSGYVAPPSGYTRVDTDLNKGVKGDYIYLNYKQNYDPDATGYQFFSVKYDETYMGPNWYPITDTNGNMVDLNKGAGGYYVYLFGYISPELTEADKEIKTYQNLISTLKYTGYSSSGSYTSQTSSSSHSSSSSSSHTGTSSSSSGRSGNSSSSRSDSSSSGDSGSSGSSSSSGHSSSSGSTSSSGHSSSSGSTSSSGHSSSSGSTSSSNSSSTSDSSSTSSSSSGHRTGSSGHR